MRDGLVADRTITVVAAQVCAVAQDPAGSFAVFEHALHDGLRLAPDADLVVFPELLLGREDPYVAPVSGDVDDPFPIEIPGEHTRRIGEVVRHAGCYVVAGSVLERSGDATFNTALVFAPTGELIATHRKVFPWRPWESSDAGDDLTTFDIDGKGCVGLMVCYDGWFPEVARGLALLGSELIVQVSATATADREEELVLARANAIVNQCFVLNVNAATTYAGGRSICVDPEGRALFLAGEGPVLIPEVVDLHRASVVRERGTRGLNRLMREVTIAPAGFRERFASLVTTAHERAIPGVVMSRRQDHSEGDAELPADAP